LNNDACDSSQKAVLQDEIPSAQINNQSLGPQGRPQLRLQKSYQFQVPKTNPKLAPCTCSLGHDNLSLSVLLMKEAPFLKPAIEALRGLA